MFAERLARVRMAMAAQGLDALAISIGADLPYLTGYEAMPLERLTMLVVPVLYSMTKEFRLQPEPQGIVK